MSRKVRVFVSSTMEDLANEREAVVSQIDDIGLVPVNAEGMSPNGGKSWEVLVEEIASSHIFVLIQGSRYGWIPTSGYGKEFDKSVTHLEFDCARQNHLPVLPFQKRLAYGADSTSEDAKRRDDFRSEVGDWDGGYFRKDFNLASDLAISVRKALMDVFQDTFLKRQVKASQAASATISSTANLAAPFNSVASEPNERGIILFAGAGLSIAAGYPSASSLVEVLGQHLGLHYTGPEILSRHSFVDIATYTEEKLGRDALTKVIQELLNTPIPVEPTKAHLIAVQSFRAIVTTNYDLMFERACEKLGIPFKVRLPTQVYQPESNVLEIYKVDGSIDQLSSLRLTHRDCEASSSNSRIWESISEILKSRYLVVAGQSLRDPTGQRILSERDKAHCGYYVSPQLDELDAIMLARYNLVGFQATADEFMERELPRILTKRC
ncbi:DUF4062 domain-containing protein [uncultured Cohaesibacter sp.]|uniref:DUF4062 domain-containing protein n=1 Tax=uncultured Cohaesibacter sp. TaxID=1002546 RepID=UPI002AA7F220|nr:DUF4062 domain-containing protein [uncultured Cohaesibacter sp.]